MIANVFFDQGFLKTTFLVSIALSLFCSDRYKIRYAKNFNLPLSRLVDLNLGIEYNIFKYLNRFGLIMSCYGFDGKNLNEDISL